MVVIRKVILSVLVLLLAVGCGGKEEREAAYLERGKALFAVGEDVKAQLEFRNTLQINPKNVDAQYHLGLIAERQANFAEAYARFTRVVEEDPAHAQAQLKLAQIYLIDNDFDKAKEKIAVLESLNSEAADVYALRATLALRQGRPQEARLLAEVALAKDPANLSAEMILVGALYNLGDTAGMLAALDAALDKNPQKVALHLLKVQYNLSLDRFDEAIAAYRGLIHLQPNEFAHRLNLAKLYVSRERVGEAEAVLRDAVKAGAGTKGELAIVDLLAQRVGLAEAEGEVRGLMAASPNEYAYAFKLASLYADHERAAEAEAVLQAIIDDPASGASGVDARVNLARLALARGDRARAGEYIHGVLEKEPENAAAITLRGALALKAGDADAALADARTVLRGEGDDPAALRLLGETELRLGEPLQAMEALSRLAAAQPDDPAVREQLARVHAERGEHNQALDLYNAILAKTPERSQSLVPKAELLIAQGQWGAAESTIRTIAALPGEQAAAHLLTGRLRLARGQTDEAVHAFREAQALRPEASEPISGAVQAYVAADRTDDALAYLDKVLAVRAEDAFALNLRGEVLTRAGLPDDAAAAFAAAIAARPEWEVPHVNLGGLMVAGERYSEAETAYRAGLDRLPDSLPLLLALAAAQERSGDPEQAIVTYETLLAKRPSEEVAINNYATLVADFAHDEPAALARAFNLSKRFETSNNPFMLDTLGWVQYRRGDYAQARIYLDRATRTGSDVAVIHYHLGMALYRLNDIENARRALEKALAGAEPFPGYDEAEQTLAKLQKN